MLSTLYDEVFILNYRYLSSIKAASINHYNKGIISPVILDLYASLLSVYIKNNMPLWNTLLGKLIAKANICPIHMYYFQLTLN